jgi:hypothetical protein
VGSDFHHCRLLLASRQHDQLHEAQTEHYGSAQWETFPLQRSTASTPPITVLPTGSVVTRQICDYGLERFEKRLPWSSGQSTLSVVRDILNRGDAVHQLHARGHGSLAS